MDASVIIAFAVVGCFLARKQSDSGNLFCLLFLCFFVWQLVVPFLAGRRIFWTSIPLQDVEWDAWFSVIMVFISGYWAASYGGVRSRDTVNKNRKLNWRDIGFITIASALIAYTILSEGFLSYFFAYRLNCGDCIEANDLNGLLTRSIPRMILWYYLILWGIIQPSDRVKMWKRVPIVLFAGLVLFPPTAVSRYLYFGYAMSVFLLVMPQTKHWYTTFYLTYPRLLYFPFGIISYIRSGFRPPESILGYVNSFDFTSFETHMTAIQYAYDNGYAYGNIMLSSLVPLPRQIFPGKWEGTGVVMRDWGYLVFPNVGVSPFSELFMDFGWWSMIVWPVVVYFAARIMRNGSIAYIGLLPVLLRGSLLAFGAMLICLYFTAYLDRLRYWRAQKQRFAHEISRSRRK